ncbi:hypothetical protein BDW42DRAFT_40405 [Aspergillus taichungensis]|uniref:MFS general substrate transporter n=1 Tax=Aspergillus taichungensis TaxID=482145 RepID=A0A2J5I3K0_9EURO|nr:hypothetical protein BDW42DRAFT_40405 [Aspergillus taichungensis]
MESRDEIQMNMPECPTDLDNLTNTDGNSALLAADEFVTRFDLAGSRNEIRRAVLWYYYPDEYPDMADDMPSWPRPENAPLAKIPINWISVCYAAGLASLLLSDPGSGQSIHYSTDLTDLYLMLPALYPAPLGCVLSLISNLYYGRRQAFRLGGSMALVASIWWLTDLLSDRHFWRSSFSEVAAIVLISTSLLYITETRKSSTRGHSFVMWYTGVVAFSSILRFISRISLLITPIFAVIASLILLIFSVAMPESPYWLASTGNVRDAYYSLRRMRETPTEAGRDIYQMYDTIFSRQHQFKDDTVESPLGRSAEPEPSRDPATRKLCSPVIACILLMFTRGFSNVFVFGRSLSFLKDTFSANTSYFHKWVFFPLVRLIAIILVSPFAIHLQRKRTTLSALCGMCFCIFSATVATFAEDQIADEVFEIGCSLLHLFAEVPITLFISEIFPLVGRELGISLAVSIYFGSTFVLGHLIYLLQRFDLEFVYLGVLLILLPTAAFQISRVTKETKGMSLEHNSLGFAALTSF